ncbi:hypothetical protein CKQ79_28990, partial [Klebsiella pneumoniae]
LAQGNTIAASNTLRAMPPRRQKPRRTPASWRVWQPDQRHARFAPAGELQPAVGDGRKTTWRRAIPSPPAIPCGRCLRAAKSPGGRRQAGAS